MHPVPSNMHGSSLISQMSKRFRAPMTLSRKVSTLCVSHQSMLGRPVLPAALTIKLGFTSSISLETKRQTQEKGRQELFCLLEDGFTVLQARFGSNGLVSLISQKLDDLLANPGSVGEGQTRGGKRRHSKTASLPAVLSSKYQPSAHNVKTL